VSASEISGPAGRRTAVPTPPAAVATGGDIPGASAAGWTRVHDDEDRVVHDHMCVDCSTVEPWPGALCDPFCRWVGFCSRCETMHREHCRCLGTNLGDGCDLQPAWASAAADAAYHDTFRWPPVGAR
jgi:hypothetical protein